MILNYPGRSNRKSLPIQHHAIGVLHVIVVEKTELNRLRLNHVLLHTAKYFRLVVLDFPANHFSLKTSLCRFQPAKDLALSQDN